METLPAGITGFDHIAYGERRWNGAVWADIQVERYNAELDRIADRHRAGMDVQYLVDGLYNLAHGFDIAGKETVKVPRGISGKQRDLFLSLTAEQRNIYIYRYGVVGQPAALAYRYATLGY